MSVYTPVGLAALVDWLPPCRVGLARQCTGIAAGVENSNFFVSTEHGEYVLTLFERLAEHELDFYLGLMSHLAARSYPCPQPLAGDGALWRPLAGKPAALVSRLPGRCIEQATPEHCRQIGHSLARLHVLAADYLPRLPNPRGAAWRAAAAARLLDKLPATEAAQLEAELAFQQAQDFSRLPRGIVHADLFRDNVLWQGDTLSGVLDFYFAGEDVLLFDLAVAANDWCADAAAETALLQGYESTRALTAEERAAWPAQRRAAALRFWLSRLDDLHHPRPGAVVTVKDPAHFGAMLARLAAA